MDLSEAAKRFLDGDENDPDVVSTLMQDSDAAGRDYYFAVACTRDATIFKQFPDILKRIIKSESWREWHWVGRKFVARSLTEYLTKSPPYGVGTTLPIVEKLIAEDAEALTMFRKQTTKPHGTNQFSKLEDNETSDEENDKVILPKTDDEKVENNKKEPTKKDTIKPEQGNSRAYTLSRLERERPDLHAKVLAGELSPNGAATIAGWRQSHLQLLQMHWKKATDQEREDFKDWIEDYTDPE